MQNQSNSWTVTLQCLLTVAVRAPRKCTISRTGVDRVPTLPGYSLLEQGTIQPLVEWPEKTATLAGNDLLM